MKPYSSIARQTVNILTYIGQEAVSVNTSEDNGTLDALYKMHNLFPSCAVITCPKRNGRFFYISDNCENIFGYSAAYMATHFRELASYIAQIHEADIADYKTCISVFESFLKTQAPEDMHKMRMVMYYRFRHAQGHYQYLHDEMATLVTSGGSIVHYCLVRSMLPTTVFKGVKMEVFKQDATLQKILEHTPSQKKKLSGREGELIKLIKQGFTTKEIASQLSISQHTVRNIKSKLFAKFSVNNTIELLNMAG